MNVFMSLQAGQLSKYLITFTAGVWFVTCVYSLMLLQINLMLETLVAFFAIVLFSIRVRFVAFCQDTSDFLVIIYVCFGMSS